MEATATLKYLKASPQKVRLVVDLLRGKKVEEALQILRGMLFHEAKDAQSLVDFLASNQVRHQANFLRR